MKLSFRLVGLAGWRVALGHGHVLAGGNLLEVLSSTQLASIGGHLDKGLNSSDTGDDSLKSDQLSEVFSLDLADRERLLAGWGLEDDLARRK